MQIFFGIRSARGPRLWAGLGAEAAIDAGLKDPRLDFAGMLAIAGAVFRKEAADGATFAEQTEILDFMDSMAGYLETGYERLVRYGTPTGYQVEISGYRLPGIDFSIYGKMDWTWPTRFVDLKTTQRVPSKPEPKLDHVRQMTTYGDAAGIDEAVLIYTGEEKYQEITLTPEHKALGRFHTRALVEPMDRILNNFESVTADGADWQRPFRIYPPRDPYSYRWDDRMREAARVIWNYDLPSGD
jgi:hypothetical protein